MFIVDLFSLILITHAHMHTHTHARTHVRTYVRMCVYKMILYGLCNVIMRVATWPIRPMAVIGIAIVYNIAGLLRQNDLMTVINKGTTFRPNWRR